MRETAVLQTLAYHVLFEDLLTVEQIHEFLITPDPISLMSVHRSVEQLLRKHQIIQRGQYYSLLSFLQQNVRRHADRMRASQEKLTIARRASNVISFVPWMKLVVVTGALAMQNTDRSDDIDFMIVTSRNRLWLTRPLVMLLVSLFFKRRKANLSNWSNLTNAFCLNLWLDEDTLAIPNNQRNLYTAHELAQMKPLVNRDRTYERMMWKNRWGRKFLANAWKKVQGSSSKYQVARGSWILGALNYMCYKFQYWYMRSKMTTERVSFHAAYFHPGNRSTDILRRYQQLLDKVKKDI